jgi:hypothetical protein
MRISMHTMAVDSFMPMLESLSAILEKGTASTKTTGLDLMNARLAPDMFTLAQQVQLACDHAKDSVSRLTGREPSPVENHEMSLEDLRDRIAKTVEYLKLVEVEAFEGAEDRDCSIPLPNNKVITMNGFQFLRAWALPHFYFHVVTAYDILRHNQVVIGKQDYLSQVGGFIRSLARDRIAAP